MIQPIKKDAFIHLDNETATLKAHTGRLWSIGAVTTGPNYEELPGINMYFEAIRLPHPECWDKDTLSWAAKTYGPDFIPTCMQVGLTDFRTIWHDLASQFTLYVETIEAAGYIPHLVTNHTDFDVTFLKVMYDKIDWKFPIKYNRIWDMPSLLAASARMPVSDAYAAIGQSKAQVKHTALADAVAQMEVLKKYNVYLPVSSKS